MPVSRSFDALRVLVIDDNLDQVHTLAFLLKDMGHQTEFAVNGNSALEAARRFRPNVVLLDLGLPDMDGSELCRRLRAEPGLEQVRIVVITGSTHSDAHRRVVDAGCEELLVKPVDPAFLESLLGTRYV